MKRKAPDQCDQSKSVTKVRKNENKSRDKWFYFFLITNHPACNKENLTIMRKKASDNSVGKEAKSMVSMSSADICKDFKFGQV